MGTFRCTNVTIYPYMSLRQSTEQKVCTAHAWITCAGTFLNNWEGGGDFPGWGLPRVGVHPVLYSTGIQC